MLPVHPVFEDEKSNWSDEKSVKLKFVFKKTYRTNIIATNLEKSEHESMEGKRDGEERESV